MEMSRATGKVPAYVWSGDQGSGVTVASVIRTSSRGLSRRAAQPSATLHDELRVSMHFRVIEELGPVLYDRALTDDESAPPGPRDTGAVARQGGALPAFRRWSATTCSPRSPAMCSGMARSTPCSTTRHHRSHGQRSLRGLSSSGQGRSSATPIRFVDGIHLRRIIDKIVGQVGRRVDEATPMVDARLPDGSRINAVVHPLAIGGPFLTIRKFAVDPFTETDLIASER